MLRMWEWTKKIYCEWCFVFDLSPGLWFYLSYGPSQSLQLQGGSSWCICFTFSVLLLSDALFFSAGWSCLDSHLNVALVASEFIVGILLWKAWYQSVATWNEFSCRDQLVYTCFSLANWSFFSSFCYHFPTSSVIHSLLHWGPLGLSEMTLLLNDVPWWPKFPL